MDRRRPRRAAAHDRRPGHDRAAHGRQPHQTELRRRLLQAPELLVRGRGGGDRDGGKRAAGPRRRLPPLPEQADDAQRPRPRRQHVRRRGGHRPAGQRRRRGVRRHHRRPAVRPPRHVVGRRRDQAGPHPLLRQGVPPRGLPPRWHGAVHGRHRRLRQAPGPGGQRRRRLMSTSSPARSIRPQCVFPHSQSVTVLLRDSKEGLQKNPSLWITFCNVHDAHEVRL